MIRIIAFVMMLMAAFMIKTMIASTVVDHAPSKKLLALVDGTQENLSYSRYVLGGEYLNVAKGIYKVDCSGYVNQLLRRAAPQAFSELASDLKTQDPNTTAYYGYLKSTVKEGDADHWQAVNKVNDLKAGDILVLTYKNMRGKRVGGHMVVVLNQPKEHQGSTTAYEVRIADSTPYRHANDTRPAGTTGVGQGTMMLKTDNSGQPVAYAWTTKPQWKYTMRYAMMRAI